MPDRVQTIKALQKIHTHFWIKFRGCGIKAEKAKYQERLSVIADAISLLKEQKKQKFFVDSDGKITPLPDVVRCKDCKHGEQLSPDYISCQISDENESGCPASHKPDWYCADGERKEEEP